jgi:iron complex outermembrane receptor protein
VKEIAFNIQINNIFDAQYESSGWVYSCYSDSAEGRTRYADRAYFPQAGTNVLANVRMKF